MRYIAVILLAAALCSCQYRAVVNAADHTEWEWANFEYTDTYRHRGAITGVSIGDTHYRIGNYDWVERQRKSYDYYYQKALRNGWNANWYADRNASKAQDYWGFSRD